MRLTKYFLVCLVLLTSHSWAQSPREVLLSSKGRQAISKLFQEVPALPVADPLAESYRLTINPPFSSPISIRVEKRQDKVVLTAN